MKAYIISVVLSILFANVSGGSADSTCDDYYSCTDADGNSGYECGDDEDMCYSCDVLYELDCATCSCQVSAGGYIVGVVIWAMIYFCCGICIYSCRRGHCCRECCYPNGMPINQSMQQSRRPIPHSSTQFVKCEFCGWLEKPGTIRCSKCNTSISSISNIGSSNNLSKALLANDVSVGNTENSVSSNNPTDFIQCVSCNRYQFSQSSSTGNCFYCKKPLSQSKKKEVKEEEGGGEVDLNTDNIVEIKQDNDLKKCNNCNEFINKESKFCNYCGTKVEDEKRCSNCNELFEKPCKFCPNCGTKAS